MWRPWIDDNYRNAPRYGRLHDIGRFRLTLPRTTVPYCKQQIDVRQENIIRAVVSTYPFAAQSRKFQL